MPHGRGEDGTIASENATPRIARQTIAISLVACLAGAVIGVV